MKTKTLAILLIIISFGLKAQEKFYGNWIITQYIELVKNENYMTIDSIIPMELQAFQDSVIESTESIISFLSIKEKGNVVINDSDSEKNKWTKINSDTILIHQNDWTVKAITDSNVIVIFDNLTKGKYKGIKLPDNQLKDAPNLIGKKIMFDALSNGKYNLEFKNDTIINYENRYGDGIGKWKLNNFENLIILFIDLDNYQEFIFYLYSETQNDFNALMFHSNLNMIFGDKIDTKLFIQ